MDVTTRCINLLFGRALANSEERAEQIGPWQLPPAAAAAAGRRRQQP